MNFNDDYEKYIEISTVKDIYVTDLIVVHYTLDCVKQGNALVDALQEMYPHNKVIAVPYGIEVKSGR